MGNLIKTGFLLVVLTCLLVLVGGAIGGRQGMTIAFVLALVMNVGSYWFSDKIVLASYGARPVTEAEAPQLYRIVRELAAQARIPVPPIYIMQDDSPNAFATGRNPQHAAVAVTEGILRIMTEDELRGVLAHELSHVKNRDTLIMTIAATIAGAITYLAQMAQWAAIFGGGRRSDDEGGGGAAPSARSSWPSSPPSRPCSSRWPSRARASTRPTRRARASPAAPPGSSTRCRSSTWRRGRCPWRRPRPPPTSSSSTRSPPGACLAVLDASAHRGAHRASEGDEALIATGLEAVRGATAPPPASDLMIQAVHLRKIFGPTSVLDDVSLELGAGHGVTLLGANGTGKTTLLRILATLVRPTGARCASRASTR